MGLVSVPSELSVKGPGNRCRGQSQDTRPRPTGHQGRGNIAFASKVTRARAFPVDGEEGVRTIYNEQSPRA